MLRVYYINRLNQNGKNSGTKSISIALLLNPRYCNVKTATIISHPRRMLMLLNTIDVKLLAHKAIRPNLSLPFLEYTVSTYDIVKKAQNK